MLALTRHFRVPARPSRRRRTPRALAAATASLALLAGTVVGSAPATAATDAVLSIDKSTATASVAPGESLVWEVTIGCESLDTICVGATFHDVVPAEFTVEDVRVVGATNAPQVVVAGSDITVEFADADPRFPGIAGILDGQRLSVLITAKLRGDIPASRDGDTVINTANVTASNADPRSSSASVGLAVAPTVAVATSKTWKPSQQLAGDPAPTTVTLTVANTSNIAADLLTLTEPANGHDPFASVAFDGFGALTFPAGADRVALTVTTGSGSTSVPPAESLVIPDEIDPADITGFVLEFSSSQGAGRINPVGDGGSPGSIAYQVVQRSLPTDATTIVANRVGATVTTGRGTANATADASLTVRALTNTVAADKTFLPDLVNRGGASVVVVGAKNDANTPFTSMRITEPAPGTSTLAQNGLTFVGFGASGDGNVTTSNAALWPSGATSATIVYRYADGEGDPIVITASDRAALPMPEAGKQVVGFTVQWEGEIAPGARGTMPFRVLTSDSTPASVTNEVRVDAQGPTGASHDTANDVLAVKDLAITSTIAKSFNASSGANSPDQEFVTTLTARPSGNAPVHSLVLEDKPDSALWSAFTATRVTTTTVPSSATLAINTWNGAAWAPVAGAEELTGAVELALPSDAKGIQFVYTAKPGAEIARGTDVRARFIVQLDETLDAPGSFSNCAVSTVAGDGTLAGGSTAPACATVSIGGTAGGVTPVLKASTTKMWTGPLVVSSDPTAPLPTTTMTIAVKNTSGINVTSLTLTDPVDGAEAFEYFDITDVVSISMPTGHSPADTVVVLTRVGGVTETFTGASGRTAVLALTKDQLADVQNITVTAAGVIPHNTSLTVQLKTQLRETVRTASTVITVPEGGKLTVGNEVRGAVANPTSSVAVDKTAQVDVYREADVPLGATLTKSLSPDSGTIHTQDPRIVKLALGITRTAGDVSRYVIEDNTSTFWNAFTANGTVRLTNPQGATTAITARVDYFSAATFAEDSGDIVVTGGSWKQGTAFTLPASTSLVPVDKLPAVPVGEVQGVRVVFEASGSAKLHNGTYRAEFETVTRTVLRTGGPVTDTTAAPMPGEQFGGVVTDTATATVTNTTNKTLDVVPATATFTFTAGVPGVAITKTPAMNSLVPGEKQQFALTVRNTGSTAIVNPVIQDVVPHDATAALLVRDDVRTGEIQYSVTPAAATMTTDPSEIDVAVTVDDPGTGEPDKLTRYAFTFPNGTVLLPGQEYTVTIPMEVRAGVARDTVFDNTFEFTADGGISASTTAVVHVLEGGSYYRTKDVREDLTPGQSPTGHYHTLDHSDVCLSDEGFARVPCVVKTQPGGTATWRLRVMNTGNLPTTTLTMVDVLPYPGDTGASHSLSSVSRGTTWTPEFLGNLAFFDEPAGTTRTVWYQTAEQERCVFGPNPNSVDPFGDTCDDWRSDAPADLADVTAIKVEYRFANLLQPGESVGLTYQTRTLDELPTGVDPYLANGTPAPAWNSFVVFTTTDKGSGVLEYETLEPNKAGIAFATPVAVGDIVWVDQNRNGLQDDGEPGLPDVTVTLHDAATGDVVGTTSTDGDGAYLFDDLLAGEYYATFTLTPEQQERYEFTFERRGTDVTVDSNPDRATGRTDVFRLDAPSAADNMVPASEYERADLVADYINPTIDAGLIAASVGVSDTVWLDLNRDGIQDLGGPVPSAGAPVPLAGDPVPLAGDPVPLAGDRVPTDPDAVVEPGIEGVVLRISGPDGGPVTDVFGNPVGPELTDEFGIYSFEHLPVLLPGQSYRVWVDYQASAAALRNLVPTVAEVGADRGLDSSTHFADSGDLIVDREHDPTLDFGFYYLAPAVDDSLPFTGLALGALLGPLALLLGGGIVLVLTARVRRRAG